MVVWPAFPEVPATLESVGQSISDDSGVEIRLVDFLDVDLWIFHPEPIGEFGRDLPNVLAAFPDNHSWFLGFEDDLGPHRGFGDIHPAVACAAEFVTEELVDLGALQAVFDELVFVCH